MKKLYFFVALVLLASCTSTYQFVQLQEYSTENGSLTVENEDIQITYSVEHLYEGWCEYSVYNKTDGFVYIDKSKSYTIDQLGYAHNVISSEDLATVVEGKQQWQNPTTKDSTHYTIYTSSDMIVVPPKAKKMVYGLAEGPDRVVDCDLPRYPSTKVSVSIDEIVFTAVTTYRTDRMQDERVVKNAVTLDKVSNMPDYIIAKYVKRTTVCENEKVPGKVYSSDQDPVYDKYYDKPAGSIVLPYFVHDSSVRLYDHRPEYQWSSYEKGYKKIYHFFPLSARR